MSKSQIFEVTLFLLTLLKTFDAFSIRPVQRHALLSRQNVEDKATVVVATWKTSNVAFVNNRDTTLLFAAALVSSSTLSNKMDTKREATTTETVVKDKMERLLAPITSSIHRPSLSSSKSDPSLWDNLAPNLWENPRGVDVRVHWSSSGGRGSRSEMDHFDDHDNCNDKDDIDYFEQVAATLLDQIKEQKQQNQHHHQQQQQQQQQHHREQQQRQQLAESMQYFTTFCNHHLVGGALNNNNYNGSDGACVGAFEFTARLVASRGAASTKCPSWHQDHVPIRWIQALSGPGCQWIDPKDFLKSNKSRINNKSSDQRIETMSTLNYNDDDDDHDNETLLLENIVDRNKRLVDPSIPQQQAAPGEAVMLVGQRWHEFAKKNDSDAVVRRRNDNDDVVEDTDQSSSSSSSPSLPLWLEAVVHKSPDGIMPWQGRVLLTMDVLVPPPCSDSA